MVEDALGKIALIGETVYMLERRLGYHSQRYIQRYTIRAEGVSPG